MKSWNSFCPVLLLLLLTACADTPPDSVNSPTDPPPTMKIAVDEAPTLAAETEPPSRDSQSPDDQNSDVPDKPSALFREADCPMALPDEFPVECGYLTVPENRTTPDSPNIELAVAILRAPDQERQPDPIVYLAGGPGGSALSDFESEPEVWVEEYPFSWTRDLIFIDQRGTGYSTPSLNCEEVEMADEGDEMPELACRDRLLTKGIDLTAYNTTENAADVAALIKTLGYNEWNILGISYGTRLALAVMRNHPQGLRSVLLDSPFPPNADTPTVEALNTWESLRLLFRDCAADAECAAAFPDLETVLLETVADLNEDPDAEIYGDDLVLLLEEAMTAGADYIDLLPLLIHDVAEGDFGLYDDLAAELQGEGDFRHFQDEVDRTDSEGMYNSVICRDEFAFGDYEAAEERALAEIPDELQEALFGFTAQLFEVCEAWGAGTAAAVENEAVVSDIPTLILVGEYDPATPPKWAYLTAETLSQATVAEFRGAGHSLLSSDECAIEMTTEFFDTPTVAPNLSCLNALTGPLFFVE